jgi:two-component system, OmpR family, sensor kinase
VRDRLFTHAMRESSRAGRLIADLLLVARLDQGRPPRRVPTDVVALLQDEAERIGELAPHLTAAVSLHRTPDGPVLLDEEELREAVGNILDNARRHAAERVEVELDGGADELEIRIADDGPGVPDGAEELIFERFAALDGHQGSGLGLAIARGIAEAHGGSLCYEDAAFVMRLPLLATSEDAPATV